MRTFSFICFVLFFTSTSFSQGGWDIDYIYADQITSNLIGKKVRLDFRHKQEAAKRTQWIRAIISYQDSGSVLTNHARIKLLEKRVLYVDQGFLSEQTLVSENADNPLIIYDSEIMEVTEQNIKLKLFTQNIHTSTYLIAWVDISQLDGLMIRSTNGQETQSLIDSLRFVSDLPYICRSQTLEQIKESLVPIRGCGDLLFWRLVQEREKIIPQLLEKMTDTTQTKLFVPYVGGKYAVADIALAVFEEIVKDVPSFKLLGVNPKKYSSPSYAYWTKVRRKRLKFKKALSKWYYKNKDNMIWVVSDETLTGDSSLKHPGGGHFEIKK